MLAAGVGVIGGLVNIFFYYATESVRLLFLRQPGELVEVAERMVLWERVVTPTLGGLCAGLVLYWGLRMAGPLRSSNLLEVLVAGDGRLPFRSGLVKFLSSLVTIGSGGSIGREGGIVQLSATLASKWGQLAKWQPYRLRLLGGGGGASGIAAAYNAPISGAVFAALIVLGNFSMSRFAPLVFASVVATMVSRSFFGIKPFAGTSLFKGDSSPGNPHEAEDHRLARLAIRYILCNPAITAPIPGLITVQQVDNMALAVKERRELDREEKALLDRAMDRAWANLPAKYQWLKEWEYV